MESFEEINRHVLSMIPNDEWERVVNGPELVDIDGEFAGFVDIYYRLSQMIPKHWTVVDIGCAYNPQAYLFKDHARLISVDPGDIPRFNVGEFYNTTGQEFIRKIMPDLGLNMDTTFAICSYVPSNEARLFVGTTFKNLFVYYPAGEFFKLTKPLSK